MRKPGWIICCFLLLTAAACKSNSNSVKQLPLKLTISFISIGEGIDLTAREKLLSYIKTFEKEAGIPVSCVAIAWGREGETDYCFNLENMSKSGRKDFVKGCKNLVQGNELVHITENQPCRDNK